jgi:hypothetical protein
MRRTGHPKTSPVRAVISAGFALLLVCLPQSVMADAGAGPRLKPDVRLLIDNSGSMKASDPDNLRAPALDLIVRLLPEGSRAGVWIFDQEVKPLVPHQVIDDSWREAARRAVDSIDNSGQRTNIPAALAAATYDLDHLDPAFRTSIILLTDGKVDVSPSPMVNAGAARTVLNTLAPDLGATGIAVHTVALSEEADWVFLRSLAESTAGIAEKADSPAELSSIFLQSLEMVAPTARVPVAGSRFWIDDSVKEFSALVFYESEKTRLGLVSPSGDRYRPAEPVEGVKWYDNRRFALVTVREPRAGEWQLVAPRGARTRVTVISDLELEVDPLPNSLPAGRRAELGLRLIEKGRVVTDPELLGLFAITLEISGPRGYGIDLDVSRAYPIPADGEYRISVPPFEEPGRYQMLARVSAETLQRELPMYIEVMATPAKSKVVTRGAEIPEEDLRTPLLALTTLALVGGVVVALILRRRKRRKLEVWQRRSRQLSGEADAEVVEGMSASTDDAARH